MTFGRPRRALLLLSLIGCLVTLGLGWAFWSDTSIESAVGQTARSSASERTITVDISKRRTLTQSFSLSGTLVARETLPLGAALEGQRIMAVMVEEGDWVSKGDVLVHVEANTLHSQMRDTEGRVAHATAALSQQRAQLNEAKAQFARAGRLRVSDAVSAETYDERQTALLSAEQMVVAAQADLAQAEAQRDEARIRLERAELRAPTDGTVVERLARPGAMVGSDPLVTLMRNGEMELDAEAPEANLPSLAAGQHAQVFIAGHSGAFEGQIRLVGARVDPDTRLGRVRIFLGKDSRLRVGAFARAVLVIGSRNVVTIAASAIQYRTASGEASVAVVDDGGRVERRPVTIGLRQGDFVEIASGLRESERVALGAAAFLRDGERVALARDASSEGGAQR